MSRATWGYRFWYPERGYEHIKQAIALQLFGGAWKTLTAGMGGVDFVVEDDTGRVAVAPTGAEVHFEDRERDVRA